MPTADEVLGPVTFSVEDSESIFILEPSAFRGAWESAAVLTIDLGPVTLEVLEPADA